MAIAIFDFDGTIISRDSLPDFLIQACGRKAFLLRLPWIILLKGAALTGILSTHRAKELVISSFLRGMKAEDFHQACLKYASRIPAFVYPAALKEIRRHQEEGNKYNPQNEMFRLLGTKRSFSQNETFFFSHPYPALFRLISHF